MQDSSQGSNTPKPSQEEIVRFEKRVLAALEQEQARIARELHDDISQRITLLIWESQKLERRALSKTADSADCRAWITGELQKLANDVQTIAHRMHPSHLQSLGLGAAAEMLCRDLAARHDVDIRFRCEGIRRDLSKDISLCLYRVLQEALQNAIKHSKVKQISAALVGTRRHVRLIITDRGVGFDAAREDKKQGLGLITMRERIRLLHGHFTLVSIPGQGTTIRCTVRQEL
jgi:signal transduction histidine kinase